jgi:hypothetical protein
MTSKLVSSRLAAKLACVRLNEGSQQLNSLLGLLYGTTSISQLCITASGNGGPLRGIFGIVFDAAPVPRDRAGPAEASLWLPDA